MSRPPKAGRRRGRPPKSERPDTPQELLDAALRLFAEQGYAATTVRQIAEAVGIRDSAIYAHFSAKRELLDALIAESGPRLIDQLDVDFAALSDRHPADALPELFSRLVAAWAEPRARMLMSLVTREGLIGVDEALRDLRERLRPHVDTWVERGRLRSDLPIATLVWELVTPVAAVRLLHLNSQATPRRRREARELVERHVAHFLAVAADSAATDAS